MWIDVIWVAVICYETLAMKVVQDDVRAGALITANRDKWNVVTCAQLLASR